MYMYLVSNSKIDATETNPSIRKVSGSNPSWVKSKTEKLSPVASLVSIYHLRARTGLVGPVSV